jgi:hypothetical protein
MYVVAMSKDNSANYHQRIHALDLTTGTDELTPVEIQATYPGQGTESKNGMQTFDPKQHKDRAALVIVNGVVYTSWGSHCDISPYTSWVIGYSESNLAQLSVLNLTPNGNDGGIWAAGSGPAVDAAGSLYLLLGNGTFDTSLNANGFPSNGDYGNGFVKLSTVGGPLTVSDYFTMSNTVSESNVDADLGSGGAMTLPPLNDSQGHSRSLAVGAGKDGHIYVVDQNNMGKFHATNQIYEDLPGVLPNGVWSSPAWFNGTLYYGAVNDNLKAFVFSNGAFPSSPSSESAITFTYPGTIPSISANGTANAIVWAVESAGTAVLHAYDANNLATELYNSNQAPNGRDHFGAGNKFIVPTVANGKVYAGTTNGVGAFGLLSTRTAPTLNLAKTHASNFTQGQIGAQYTVLVTDAGPGATDGSTVTVTETVPAGLSLVSMSGTGWTCVSTTCTRNDILSSGSSYPTITVTVNVATNASSPQVNRVSVSGGGAANPTSANDSTTIVRLGISTFAFRSTSNTIRLGTYPSMNSMSAGGAFAADPAVAQDASGNTFVLGRDNFGGLWLNVFNAGSQSWTGWNQAGGVFQGVPSIAVSSGETAYLSARDNSNGYWINSYTLGTGFGGWVNLGGTFTTDPVMASVSDASFYVVGKDSSNAIWSGRYIPGTGFQGWFQAGGVVKGKPSVTGGSDGAAYIAVRDIFDGIWMARVFQNTLTGWFQGGGVISADPQVASLGNGINCTVVLDVSGGTWYRPFQEGAGYQSWVAAGGKLESVSPAGVNGELFFVGRTPGQDIWWWRQSGAQWTWIGNNGVSTGVLATSPR